MKLHNDYQTQTLIDIAGQLAYHDDKINEITNGEVLQEDVEKIALYMSNRWLNDENEQVKEGSPLQNRRDFFKENYEEVVKQYFENPSELPPIDYCKFGPSIGELPPKDITHMTHTLKVGDIRYGYYDNSLPICVYDEYGANLACSVMSAYTTDIQLARGVDMEFQKEKDDNYSNEIISFEI